VHEALEVQLAQRPEDAAAEGRKVSPSTHLLRLSLCHRSSSERPSRSTIRKPPAASSPCGSWWCTVGKQGKPDIADSTGASHAIAFFLMPTLTATCPIPGSSPSSTSLCVPFPMHFSIIRLSMFIPERSGSANRTPLSYHDVTGDDSRTPVSYQDFTCTGLLATAGLPTVAGLLTMFRGEFSARTLAIVFATGSLTTVGSVTRVE